MLTTQWQIREDWFAIGISPKEDGASTSGGQGTSSNFQGFHGELIVVIFDEATGVPPKRWVQAEGMMTSANVKWVAIGNPTSPSSEFAKCFTSPVWHKIKITCFDSPNVKANGIVDTLTLLAEVDHMRSLSEQEQYARYRSYKIVQPRLLTLQWVVGQVMKLGIDHPLVQSKVLGEFPQEDEHVLIPLSAVEQSQAREHTPWPRERFSIGVDVARYGSDKTEISVLHGPKQIKKKTLIKRGNTEVAGEVIAIVREILQDTTLRPDQVTIVVDGTGTGSGVVDSLKDSQMNKAIPEGVSIREVQFGEGFKYMRDERDRLECERKYMNRKARMFVRLAEDMKELCLMDHSDYLEQLPTIKYKFDAKGKYVIESKDDYKKRTGLSSPDAADSLVLANEGRYDEYTTAQFTEEHVTHQGATTIAPSLHSNSW